MDWGALLAGIGGAAGGAAKGMTWQEEFGLEEQKVKQQKEIADERIRMQEETARLREEVRLMLEELKEGGRMTRHQEPTGTSKLLEEGRMDRWGTPSANATMAEEGRNRRHVLPSGNVVETIAAQNERWATPSGNARLSADTTRRGQDLTFDLGTMRDTTTQRGQDITAELGRGRIDASRFAAGEATKRADLRRRAAVPPWQQSPEFDAAVTTEPGQPRRPMTDRMGESIDVGATPITPPAADPPAQPKTAEAVIDQEEQRRKQVEAIGLLMAERKRNGQSVDDLIRQLQALKSKRQ